MKSCSQARQDLFVSAMLEAQPNGFYLEIGGNHPIHVNNTYALETDLGWKGLSLEIDRKMVEDYNLVRKNRCFCGDALRADYKKLLSAVGAPLRIDYLSVDIEPPSKTLQALQGLPHDLYRFSVITFEHEAYYSGNYYRDTAREFLAGLGYQLVVGDVKNTGNSYEDWYVDPLVIPEAIWKKFESSGVEFTDIPFLTTDGPTESVTLLEPSSCADPLALCQTPDQPADPR